MQGLRPIAQLNQLRELKQFLFEEKVLIKEEDLSAFGLGVLNNFRYSRAGRTPETKEWALLDLKLFKLSSYLDQDLKRKIRIRELRAFFSTFPVIFLSVIVLDIVVYDLLYLILPRVFPSLKIENQSPLSIALYSMMVVTWPAAQGGLGACAFLGTVVIGANSQDSRSTDLLPASRVVIDITDRNFLRVRLLLGILFGFLIGLPFAYKSLAGVGAWLFSITPSDPNLRDLPIVFIPFLIGFSTNLILVILSRLIMAIEIFFGLTGQK